MENKEQGGAWRMVAAMSMSGTIGVFVLLSAQTPQTVVLFRCILGAAALFGWLAWTGGYKAFDRRALGWVALGAAALVGNWLALFSSFKLSGISVATVVYHMQPFFLVLLAALAQRELPAWHKLPWLALAFLGVVLTAGLDFGAQREGMLAGVLLALLAALLYALATLATRKLSAYAPAQIAGAQLVLGALAMAPLAQFSIGEFGLRQWGSLLLVGLVHTGLMYNLMYGAFQRLRADSVATLSFIYPLVAILSDLALFDTRLGAWQVAGMGMILASVLANQRVRPPARDQASRSIKSLL
jgi:drug/metabolite transporter (DMT)-like permease